MKLDLDDEDVRRIARAVVEELRAGTMDGWLDQVASSLGRRRHISAVRKRLHSGEGGAVQIGRRFLLSREAHDAELVKLGQAPQAENDLEAAVEAELGLRLAGGSKR